MEVLKKKELLPNENMESKIWKIFDILRNENISSDDYHVVLFLLSAYKDKLISIDLINQNHQLKEILIQQLRDSNNNLFYHYTPIIHYFEPTLQKLSENGLRILFNVFAGINIDVLTKNFHIIFDSVLYRITQSQGRYAGEFIQPVELTRFMCGLADLKKDTKVFNPFAGLASFSVYFDQVQDYYGQELNQRTWALGALRLMAYERFGSSKYVCDDSILHWPDESEKFDLIISNPPFGMRLNNYYKDVEPNIRTIEQFLIEKGVQSLKQNGKLIALLPQGFLFRGMQEQRLREHLVEEDLIDTIISLPGGLLLNTSIPLIILVLGRSKKLPGKVKFVDATCFVNERNRTIKALNDKSFLSFIQSQNIDENIIRIVDNSTIRENEYNLSIGRYFVNEVLLSDNEQLVKLDDLIEIVRGQRDNLPKTGKLIRIRDLKDDKINFTLDVSIIEETELRRPDIHLISESCLLLAMRYRTLKPSLFEFKGEPIFRSPDILSFKIKEANPNIIDLDYLINELHADYVQEQINKFITATTIPLIRKNDLLKICIKLPSLQEQKAKIDGIRKEYSESKFKENIYSHRISKLENEIYEKNTYLRHTIAGPTSNLQDSINNVISIIKNQILPQLPEAMKLKISDDHISNLNDYLNILERDINKITNSISKNLKAEIDIATQKLIKIDIFSFIQDYVNELNDKRDLKYSIEFQYDKQYYFDENGKRIKVYILGNNELLTALFDNLIENAVKHAFSKGNKNRIEIYLMGDVNNNDMFNDVLFSNSTESGFWLNKDEKEEICILFSNTGKPFPKDFNHNDFIRKGAKYGSKAGDGFGGWYINEIINKMNGDFEIIDETGPEGLGDTDLATSFSIDFKITEKIENEEI